MILLRLRVAAWVTSASFSKSKYLQRGEEREESKTTGEASKVRVQGR